MARSARQSKILETISTREIASQDELVYELKVAGYDVTQATISRDIKELGIIKLLSSESGKYKYAIVENGEQALSNKFLNIFKEAFISVKIVENTCIIKTLKGMASAICGFVDKLNLENVIGAVAGDDTVMLIFPNSLYAERTSRTILNLA